MAPAAAYDRAVADFDQLIRLAPPNAVVLSKRCFARAILGRLESALSDCNGALRLNPQLSASLYGRGLAKRKTGDAEGGDADIAAAKALTSGIVEQFARYGVL
jgi:tetratricopeptide (TPR) repeat protein